MSGCSTRRAAGAVELAGGAGTCSPAAAIFVAICVFAVWVFNRDAPRIAEEL